jgi:hypothetical protein
MTTAAVAGDVRVLSVLGQVEQLTQGQWVPLKTGDAIQGTFNVRAGELGTAQLLLDGGAVLEVPRSSEVAVAAAPQANLKLVSGGLSVLAGKREVNLQALGFYFRTGGYLRLRHCGAGCKEVAGLYGKAFSGEVVVEYPGGRSVLKAKPFRVSEGGGRPVLLARDTDLLSDDNQLELAAKSKLALADQIKVGMDAFKAGQFSQARDVLLAVRETSPTEKIVSYYLGLIALELKDNDAALKHLQQYAIDDPQSARDRGVNQLVTLLLTSQLQNEVKQALQTEGAISTEKPEPNTIAVQAFTNRGDPAYAALAKGIAAMVITDLSKVPGLKVLERQKVQKLMDEIQLSESGLVTQDTMIKAGRLIRAEKVVVGSFGVQ